MRDEIIEVMKESIKHEYDQNPYIPYNKIDDVAEEIEKLIGDVYQQGFNDGAMAAASEVISER